MNLVPDPQVEREPGRDLEIIGEKEIVAPAPAVVEDTRESARGRAGNTQQKIGVWKTREPVREGLAAEEGIRHLVIQQIHASNQNAGLGVVTSKEPAHM